MRTCGVILAGGKSSRMGTNKSLLPLQGKPAVERVYEELKVVTDNVIIIANEENIYDFLQIDRYSDRHVDQGPLAGLESALYHVEADLYFIAACDMPFIDRTVYKYLVEQMDDEHDAVVPVYNGRNHPLAAIYRRSALPQIQDQIVNNNLRVQSFFEHIQVNYVDDFDSISDSIVEKHLFNMNNPNQYKQAKSF